jgi:glycine hydroxymethyltransferase
MAHYAGLVAAGLHHNPLGVADFVASTTHKTLRGPRSGLVLCRAEHARELDKNVFPGLQGGPLMHVIAGKAVCFGEALRPEFREYARRVVDNARTLAETLLAGGLALVSGGTDNHLLLADVTPLGLSGGQAEAALGRAGITVNKNMIPFDARKPLDPSGIRIGTPALTTRGMGPDELRTIGGWMLAVLRSPHEEALLTRVRGEVSDLCRHFPVPGAEVEELPDPRS